MFSAVIEEIHASKYKFGMIVTGAGSSSIAALMAVPGCSNTLLDAHIPYSFDRSEKILDYQPSQCVCAEVGRQLSQHAYFQSIQVNSNIHPETIVGLGLTAAIKTSRIRKGKDQMFLSCWSYNRVTDYELQLPSDTDREGQERLIAASIIKSMADFCHIDIPDAKISEWGIKDVNMKVFENWGSPLRMIHTPLEKNIVLYNTHGEVRADMPPFSQETMNHETTTYLIFPGTFEPLHWGHTELERVACNIISKKYPTKRIQVTYEISLTRADKENITEEKEIEKKVSQFIEMNKRVIVTNAKLFVEKAKMFPNHIFILGYDTAKRVVDAKYYGGSREEMINKINEIRDCGCSFVVGGRKEGESWKDFENNKDEMPESIRDLFLGIPEEDFRIDISSTEIREKRTSLTKLN
eukprot:Tbor_TRINITY_DN4615_c0_g1::TRINITY_DN4615_c0_g1_i1::g.14912::m.14912